MGTNKLTLSYKGKTFIEQTFALVKEIGFYECIMVTSPENVRHMLVPDGIKVVYNSHPEWGQSYSVRLGTAAAAGDGYLYFTCDQPLLTETLVAEMMELAAAERIVFPLKGDGSPSNPTLFGNHFRNELLNVDGEGGGRTVRNRHPAAWITITPDFPEQLVDIDTPEKYQHLLKGGQL